MLNRFFNRQNPQEKMNLFAKELFHEYHELSDLSKFNIIINHVNGALNTTLFISLHDISKENQIKMVKKIEKEILQQNKPHAGYYYNNLSVNKISFTCLVIPTHDNEKSIRKIQQAIHILYKGLCQAYTEYLIEKHNNISKILAKEIGIKDHINLMLQYCNFNAKPELKTTAGNTTVYSFGNLVELETLNEKKLAPR